VETKYAFAKLLFGDVRLDLPLHLLQSETWTLRDFLLQDSIYLHYSDEKNAQPVGFFPSASKLLWRTVKYIAPTMVNCADLRGAHALLSQMFSACVTPLLSHMFSACVTPLLSHMFSACVTPLRRLQRRRLQRGGRRAGVRLPHKVP
jgi:hypothetical protein